MRIESEKWIDAPREAVFAAFVDLEGMPGRIRGVESVEVLTDGPTAVGTRWRETRIMFGKEATEEMTVSGLEPGRSCTIRATSCGCEYTTVFTFSDERGGTLVRMSMTSRARTFLAKLMTPLGWLMRRTMRKLLAKDLDDLAASVESPDAAREAG